VHRIATRATILKAPRRTPKSRHLQPPSNIRTAFQTSLLHNRSPDSNMHFLAILTGSLAVVAASPFPEPTGDVQKRAAARNCKDDATYKTLSAQGAKGTDFCYEYLHLSSTTTEVTGPKKTMYSINTIPTNPTMRKLTRICLALSLSRRQQATIRVNLHEKQNQNQNQNQKHSQRRETRLSSVSSFLPWLLSLPTKSARVANVSALPRKPSPRRIIQSQFRRRPPAPPNCADLPSLEL